MSVLIHPCEYTCAVGIGFQGTMQVFSSLTLKLPHAFQVLSLLVSFAAGGQK